MKRFDCSETLRAVTGPWLPSSVLKDHKMWLELWVCAEASTAYSLYIEGHLGYNFHLDYTVSKRLTQDNEGSRTGRSLLIAFLSFLSARHAAGFGPATVCALSLLHRGFRAGITIAMMIWRASIVRAMNP